MKTTPYKLILLKGSWCINRDSVDKIKTILHNGMTVVLQHKVNSSDELLEQLTRESNLFFALENNQSTCFQVYYWNQHLDSFAAPPDAISIPLMDSPLNIVQQVQTLSDQIKLHPVLVISDRDRDAVSIIDKPDYFWLPSQVWDDWPRLADHLEISGN